MISAVIVAACLVVDLSWLGYSVRFLSTQEAYADCANTKRKNGNGEIFPKYWDPP